jgi:serine/threonine protein kinase
MNGPWDVSALPKGSLIGGRFEVQTILGIGGFGITYAAWDHHLQRHVAVKEFLPSDVTRTGDGRLVTRNDDAFRTGLDRFFQEGRILAGLRHPGIVGVFDVLAESGTAYLVMEFLVGETFEQSLQRVGRYSAEEVQNVAAQLVAALAFLHNELGDPGRPPLLHLDVSPSNVILHQTENGVRPVLIDLGSARNTAATQSRIQSNREGWFQRARVVLCEPTSHCSRRCVLTRRHAVSPDHRRRPRRLLGTRPGCTTGSRFAVGQWSSNWFDDGD